MTSFYQRLQTMSLFLSLFQFAQLILPYRALHRGADAGGQRPVRGLGFFQKGSGVDAPDPHEHYPEYLYYTALASGVSWRDIGTMSVEEIALASQAHQERTQEFARLLAWIVYNGAALAGIAMNDPKRYPTLEDAFPKLFEKKEQQNWWEIKERVNTYAKEWRDVHNSN
ncbi:hypothetical protein [Anaeromassilibacillus sp. SJQ-5]